MPGVYNIERFMCVLIKKIQIIYIYRNIFSIVKQATLQIRYKVCEPKLVSDPKVAHTSKIELFSFLTTKVC